MEWRIIADCRIGLRNTKVCTTRKTVALPTHITLEKILFAICPTPFANKGGAFGASYPTAARQPGCLPSKEALRLCASASRRVCLYRSARICVPATTTQDLL